MAHYLTSYLCLLGYNAGEARSMVVYLDLLFLMNFAINSLFVYLITLIYQEKAVPWRIIIAGLFGGALVFGFLFDYAVYHFLKICGGVLVGVLGFKIRKMRDLVLKLSSFYILNFFSVGLVAAYRIRTWYLLALALSSVALVFMVESNKKSRIFLNSCQYNISVSSEKKSLRLVGYLDTGNFSKCDDVPIVYLARKYEGDFKFHKTVIIRTVGGTMALPCYKPKSFAIEIDGTLCSKEVLIVFSEIGEFDCLLNVDLFT